MTSSLSKIWEKTDGCKYQYRCDSALYLMSVLSQCYSAIIDRGISGTWTWQRGGQWYQFHFQALYKSIHV